MVRFLVEHTTHLDGKSKPSSPPNESPGLSSTVSQQSRAQEPDVFTNTLFFEPMPQLDLRETQTPADGALFDATWDQTPGGEEMSNGVLVERALKWLLND